MDGLFTMLHDDDDEDFHVKFHSTFYKNIQHIECETIPILYQKNKTAEKNLGFCLDPGLKSNNI